MYFLTANLYAQDTTLADWQAFIATVTGVMAYDGDDRWIACLFSSAHVWLKQA